VVDVKARNDSWFTHGGYWEQDRTDTANSAAVSGAVKKSAPVKKAVSIESRCGRCADHWAAADGRSEMAAGSRPSEGSIRTQLVVTIL